MNKRSQAQTVYDVNGLSCCLSANGGGDGGKTGLYRVNNSSHQSGIVYDKKGISPCLTACDWKDPVKILEDKSDVRRLTPVECERLQGFPDDWTKYGADGSLISNTQRYKCIGNAVTTNVISFILDNWLMWDKDCEMYV